MGRDACLEGAAPSRPDPTSPLGKIVKLPYLVKFGMSPGLRDAAGQRYLMTPYYCGDFSEVLHAFETRGPKLDLERIIGYALQLDAATAKRLGWVLEHQGVKPSRLKELQAVPIKGYRVLDPTGPRRGPCNSRWIIQENLRGMG